MIDVKEIAKKYDKKLKRTGIKYNPFLLRAPDEETLINVFMNREREIENTISVIEGRRNALIYGHYGAGKTAFLKYFLYDIAGLEDPIVASTYTTFTGQSETDFLNTIAYSVATQFKEEYKPAAEVYAKMGGQEKRTPACFKTGGKYANLEGAGYTAVLNPAYTKDFIKETLKTMSEKYRILIGIDEIDKMSPRDFNKLIASIRDVISFNASFLLTGSYTFLSLAATIVSTQYGAFDIKTELTSMTKKHLTEMALKYVALAGKSPFTDDALEIIAEQSMGIPRAMMVLCNGAVETAASAGLEKITEKDLDTMMFYTGKTIFNSLLPTQKRTIRYIFSIGGEMSSVTEEVAGELGVSRARVYEHLNNLLGKDSIFETGRNDERIWKISPALISYLKKEGKK